MNIKLNYDRFSERRHEVGPIMFPIEIPKDRHQQFYSATQSRMEEFDPLASPSERHASLTETCSTRPTGEGLCPKYLRRLKNGYN